MSGAYILAVLTFVAAPTEDAIQVSARIETAVLQPGQTCTIAVDLKSEPDHPVADAKRARPILQIQVPPSVKLEGAVLTDRKELARNDFLQAPFERMLEPGRNEIRFSLAHPAAADERFGLNVIAYVGSGDGSDAWFVRKRLMLPVTGGANAQPVSADRSDWGIEPTFQIGQKAALFSLPKADGTLVNLQDYLGKKNIIVTTYRAHW